MLVAYVFKRCCNYNDVKQKLEEKKKIEEELREADTLLKKKNVSIEALNEHIQLNQKPNEHGLSRSILRSYSIPWRMLKNMDSMLKELRGSYVK